MDWVRAHPYLSALITVGVVLPLGTLLVTQKSAVSPGSPSIIAWGGFGGGGFLNSSVSGKPAETESVRGGLYQAVQNSAPFSYIPFTGANEYSAIATQDAQLSDILTFLTDAVSGGTTGSSGSGGYISDAYSFIPRGLFATTSIERVLTASQKDLYIYGNEAGSIIRGFEDENKGASRILKDQAEDPTNPVKNAGLQELAAAMESAGENLEELERVPSSASAANSALAKSYKEMGAKLTLISGVEGDDARIEAMLTYNSAVESFVKNFVALATLFSASGVTFRQFDAGNVFTFSHSVGL